MWVVHRAKTTRGESGHPGRVMTDLSRPAETLTTAPFRSSAAMAEGLVTRGALRGRSWQRLLPDVYVHSDLPIDHRVWCTAVGLTLPAGSAVGGPSAAHL